MNYSSLIALTLLVGASGACAEDAAESRQWTSWQLVSVAGTTEHVEGWQLAFHPDGRVSTSWVGPMYESEAGNEFVTLEGLEAIGAYERVGKNIIFANDDFEDGWLWRWRTVTCELSETPMDLALTHCSGAGRPEWADVDPAQPEDMTFVRLP
jgi:hypothetical protein